MRGRERERERERERGRERERERGDSREDEVQEGVDGGGCKRRVRGGISVNGLDS